MLNTPFYTAASPAAPAGDVFRQAPSAIHE
jgi:hypothetical protein